MEKMNKIKKIFTSFGVFFTSMVSKVLAFDIAMMVEDKYGVIDPRMYEIKYGIFEPTIGEKISGIGKIALPLVLFIIGLFVVLSKKITKKVKVITISILLTIGILSWIVLNYIANNY